MKNHRDLILEDLHRAIDDLPRTDDDWQVTAERSLRRIASLLAHLHDRCDLLHDRCDHLDGRGDH